MKFVHAKNITQDLVHDNLAARKYLRIQYTATHTHCRKHKNLKKSKAQFELVYFPFFCFLIR